MKSKTEGAASKVDGCAVIEIGSDSIKMGVFEGAKGELRCLDRLSCPASLGHEVFTTGHISFLSLSELTLILEKYKKACLDFGIVDIYLISTTVMREADNRDFVEDRVLTANGLAVHVLADSEEKSIIYHDLIRRMEAYPEPIPKAIIAYVGSGSIGIACMSSGHITRSYNIPLGALKLHDILGAIRKEMSDYHLVVEEYLHSVFKKIELDDCDCIVFTGTEIERIASLCQAQIKGGLPHISMRSMKNLYKEIRSKTAENIAINLGIDEVEANTLSTALSIFYELLSFAGKPGKILAPSIDIESITASHALIPAVSSSYDSHVRESSLIAARLTAVKYGCNRQHSEAVSKMTCLFFDKLKKVHGLPQKYRHILELAAVLHSCGQYVNIKQRTKCSFDLIKNMEIYGMTSEELLQVAIVSGYNEFSAPDQWDPNFRALDGKEKIVTAKLVAMFRLANALDKSQKAKISIDKIKVEDDILSIRAGSSQNAFLEQWAFEECAEFFTEIFGIRPQLTIKSPLI